MKLTTKVSQLEFLTRNGFDVVQYEILPVDATPEDIRAAIERRKPKEYRYPVDGLIMEYNDSEYGKSLGSTGHHENRMIALKWEDELYDTKFLGVELATTRTGMVSITGLFEPVTIDGTEVSRAYLHIGKPSVRQLLECSYLLDKRKPLAFRLRQLGKLLRFDFSI